ncbi:glutamine--fructose-6-phosphate transaminase (isomerizing) [Mycoplasmatota bacterium]|nr:glutamine--fructose-6-phosphate transaminase (isomerizing) [Mycoplasmatota bacterium]
MCGIVGYIGENDCKDIIIDGLKKLEYRGYDSSGVALIGDGEYVFKEKGRIVNMEQTVNRDIFASIGIGHTRWATHGRPSKINSHPHMSYDNRFILVHNGVIENEVYLRDTYLKGIDLVSETDTEILASLMSVLVKSSCCVKVGIMEFMKIVKGSYALALVDTLDNNRLYAIKNMSPMIIGVGDEFNMLGSDVSCMIKETNEFVPFEDMEFAVIGKDDFIIYDKEGVVVNRDSYISELNSDDIELGQYPHYMLKEIEEQSSVIRKILSEYYDDGFVVDNDLLSELENSDRINIIAAGTSYHAGIVGKKIIETMSNKPVDVHIASEFVYNTPVLSDNPFFIFITQSGETADSRACLKKINQLGYKSLTITNVAGSTLSREATYTLLLHAGPEIAVASTKAYTAQIAVLSILAFCISDYEIDLYKELSKVANTIDEVYSLKNKIKDYAESYLSDTRNCFYIGRGIDYYVAMEAALKLKEISYIQTEGFAAGELKHGTIALIEDNVPVLAIISSKDTNLNTRGNVKEVESRGANTLVISTKSVSNESDEIILNDVHPLLTALITVIPTQYISYYAALNRGLDIDKPRNLAKSVTVE